MRLKFDLLTILALLVLLPMRGASAATAFGDIAPATQMYTKADVDSGFQPLDTDLSAIAALTSAADKIAYATGSGTWGLTDFTSAARSLLDDATPGSMRTTLGLGALSTNNTVSTSLLDAGAVTYAKIQDVSATQRLLGRNSTGSGVTEEVTASQALDWIGSTRGSVPYRGSSGWAALAPGTSGYVLTSNGAGADPSYQVVGAAALDINGLTGITDPADSDAVPLYDASATANRKATLSEVRAYMARGVAQVRLEYSSTTSIKLLPCGGSLIEVNGEVLDVGAGLTYTTSSNLLNSTGGNSGAGPSGNTVYYAYVGNLSASYAPGELRLCATLPSGLNGSSGTSTAPDDFYLGTSGNGANWRFVGTIRTNVSTLFTDSDTSRCVASYYNRRMARLFTCPGYSDANTASSLSTTWTTWARVNTGSGDTVEWVSFADEPASLRAQVYSNNTGANVNAIGLSFNSTTSPNVQASHYPGNTVATTTSCAFEYKNTHGYHYCCLLSRTSGGTMTIYVDDARYGASADPYLSFISGTVWR